MKKKILKWFKSNHNVENVAQAGDAALYLHYEPFDHDGGSERKTIVHTQDNDRVNFMNMKKENDLEIEFWGVLYGIKKVSYTMGISPERASTMSVAEFVWEEVRGWSQRVGREADRSIEDFTHVVVKNKVDRIETVHIYRLNKIDKDCIKREVHF